jgi:hypothetical protein
MINVMKEQYFPHININETTDVIVKKSFPILAVSKFYHESFTAEV